MTSVERKTPRGHRSVWNFVEAPDAFYAFGGCHKALVRRFDNRKDFDSFYTDLIGYGYRIVTSQLSLPLEV